MATLARLINARFKVKQGAPGSSLSVDMQTEGDTTDNADLFHLPGIFGIPQDGIQGVYVDVKGMNIIVATHDYRLNIVLAKGETLFYSYDASGNILASAKCNAAGEFVVNDGIRKAVSFDELNTGLINQDALIQAELVKIAAAISSLGGSYTPGTITTDISTSVVPKVKLP